MVTIRVGDLVSLAPFEERHLLDPDYRRWLHDPEVVRYLGRPEYLTPIPFGEIHRYVTQLWSDDRCTFLAIHALADDRFIGTAKIAFKEATGPSPDVADIGVMIGDRKYWRRGYATDALRATSEYAFEDLGARKLIAGAMAPNVAVIRAFERVGFVEEGRLRAQFATPEGYVDHVLLGCLDGELLKP